MRLPHNSPTVLVIPKRLERLTVCLAYLLQFSLLYELPSYICGLDYVFTLF